MRASCTGATCRRGSCVTCVESCALAGLTAAELDGLQGFATSAIFVTQPCGTRDPRLAGVVIHYSRFLDEQDVHPLEVPRRCRLPRSIGDAAGGIASVPEREFAVLVRASQLPEPARQRILHRPDGRCYLDADWAELRLAVEVDGRGHLDVVAWDADLDWANDIVIDGRTLLRFTSYAVRHRPESVAETLRRALIARGWDGRSAR